MPFQQSVASLPEDDQDLALAATRRASKRYPSILIEGHLLHVCEMSGEFEVWINCEDADFTGVCIGVGASRQVAVTQAVRVLEALLDKLQGPPW